MKTLDQHNSEILKEQDEAKRKRRVKNGLACDDCGKELYDSDTDFVGEPHNGMGAYTDVECDCGFKSYRLL